MKAPNAQKFPDATPPAAKPASSRKTKPKPSNQNATKTEMVRCTHNLSTDATGKINAVALQMSQERGKMVSASEALRTIIDAYKVKS